MTTSRFGELRSILHQPVWGDDALERLRRLIKQQLHADAQALREVWAPYLAAHPFAPTAPAWLSTSWEELVQMAEHLPGVSLGWYPEHRRDLRACFEADHPAFAQLTYLHLGEQRLASRGIAQLAEVWRLPKLRFLALQSNKLGDAGVQALIDGAPLPGLIALDLHSNQISQRGAAAIAATPRWPQLRSLNLCYNPIGDEGALAIARASHLEQLVELKLWESGLTAAGLALLSHDFEVSEAMTASRPSSLR